MQLWVGPTLKQILPMLSPAELRRLAEAAEVSSTNREELERRLSDQSYIAKTVRRLSTDERQLLAHWLMRGGLSALDDLQPARAFGSLVAKLARAGLAYLLRSDYYRPLFTLAAEATTPLWEAVNPAQKARLAAPERSPRQAQSITEWSPFFHDVFQLVAAADRQPIQVTQQHYVYKRVQTKLMQWLWEKGNGERQHYRFAIALQFAQVYGLLALDPDLRELVPNSEGERYWEKPFEERVQDWFQFAASIPSHQHLTPVLIWVAAGLEPDQWLDFSQLEQFLRQHKVRPEHLRQLPEVVARLSAAGIWEERARLGRLTDEAYAAWHGRWERPRPSAAIVQPTGEVLVPPETPFRERWLWNRLANPLRSDRVWVLQIDRAAIERALDFGYDQARYLAAVAKLCRTELASNLVANIQDWFRQMDRHRWIEALLLHSNSPEDSQAVERHLKDLVVRRLSERDLILRHDASAQATERLRRAGIFIRDKVELPSLPAAAPNKPAAWPTQLAGLPLWQGYSQVVVPNLDESLALYSLPELERQLSEAIRRQASLVVQYFLPGRREIRRDTIVPTQLSRGWLQALTLPARTGLTVHVTQILGLGPA